MNFCHNCGTKLLNNNQAFCTECGERLNLAQNSAQNQAGQVNESYNNINEEKTANFNYQPPKKVSLKNAIMSFVFANIVPEFALLSFIPILSFFFFPAVIVFFILSLNYRNKYINEAGRSVGFTTAAKPIAIISLIIGIFFFILSLIILTTI